jgi:hypothetical protein
MRAALLIAVVVASITITGQAFAGSEMSGTWKASNSGGKLYLRVSGGKAQMKLAGSCNPGWITLQPSDAFVLQSGNLVMNKSSFKVPIGGQCSTASANASKSGDGFQFSFRNRWRFTGSVK